MQTRLLRNILVLCSIVVSILVVVTKVLSNPQDRSTTQTFLTQTSPSANGQESGLPLPSGFLPAKLPEFQAQGFCPKRRNAAPTARDIKARGKREARRPR